MNGVILASQIAFFFDFEDNKLREFGICNAYLYKNDHL